MLGEVDRTRDLVHCVVVEGNTEVQLVSRLRRSGDLWIHELMECRTLIEVKLSDANHRDLQFSVALPRVIHVEQSVKLLELWLAEVLKRDTQLHWSMITSMHLVEAAVEVVAHAARHVRFEEAPVTVAGRLLLLVYVFHLIGIHLVAGQECDGLLHVARVVPLVHRSNQLVDRRDQRNGVVSYIVIV